MSFFVKLISTNLLERSQSPIQKDLRRPCLLEVQNYVKFRERERHEGQRR